MNQILEILNHLNKYGHITSMQAFEKYGCTRLSAKIFDLRKRGVEIETIMIDGINRYGKHTRFAKYVLKGNVTHV